MIWRGSEWAKSGLYDRPWLVRYLALGGDGGEEEYILDLRTTPRSRAHRRRGDGTVETLAADWQSWLALLEERHAAIERDERDVTERLRTKRWCEFWNREFSQMTAGTALLGLDRRVGCRVPAVTSDHARWRTLGGLRRQCGEAARFAELRVSCSTKPPSRQRKRGGILFFSASAHEILDQFHRSGLRCLLSSSEHPLRKRYNNATHSDDIDRSSPRHPTPNRKDGRFRKHFNGPTAASQYRSVYSHGSHYCLRGGGRWDRYASRRA